MDPLGLAGQVLDDKYAVDTAVGEGGFATVYKAMHLVLKRPVALKVFHAAAQFTEEEREALVHGFVQEAAVLADLSERTASICQARDVGTLTTARGEKLPYMVLEWLEGRTLEAVLEEEQATKAPPRALDKAVRWLEPVAEALSLAHGKGVAHRDVKPANIFILGKEREGIIKLLDFGIAKVVQDSHKTFSKTGAKQSSFTPAYGAPEQFVRDEGPTGPWTDVFALALVLVEIVTGKPPLAGESLVQLGYAACNPEKRPTPRTLGARVSDAAEAVFRKALAVRPADRFQTAGEFWGALVQATGAPRRSGFADVSAFVPARAPSVDLPDLDVPAAAPSKPQVGARAEGGAYGAVDFSWDGSAELDVPDLLPDVPSRASAPPASTPSGSGPASPASGRVSAPPSASAGTGRASGAPSAVTAAQASGLELAVSSRRPGPAPAAAGEEHADGDPIRAVLVGMGLVAGAGAVSTALLALLHRPRGLRLLELAPALGDGSSVKLAAGAAAVAVVLCILSGAAGALREPRSWGLVLSAVGLLGMAAGLMVVTVSAPATPDGPPAEGGFIVPLAAPLVPAGLAVALLAAGLRRWRDRDEKPLAVALAALAGCALFLAVELGFGLRG